MHRAIEGRTLAQSVVVRGVGIHTGAKASVLLSPAEPGAGIVFCAGKTEIPAVATNVTDTARCTVLGAEGVSVSTVEHLLSALSGQGVTEARITVDGRNCLSGTARPCYG